MYRVILYIQRNTDYTTYEAAHDKHLDVMP
jgi:hypothetical protein